MSENPVPNVLRAAKATIADESRWLAGRNFELPPGTDPIDDGRYAVFHQGVRPVRCCAVSALMVVCRDRFQARDANHPVYVAAFDALSAAAVEMPGKTAQGVNDRHGHAAVMDMYDRAIAAAEA